MGEKSFRIGWIDVFKALGIIAIYLGHFCNQAGKLYPFVFAYHVPLFFFAAGFFSSLKTGETYVAYLKKQFFRLLVPYVSFIILNVIVYSFANNSGIVAAIDMFKSGLYGIRNHIFASSLWFIPCLFIMSIIYNGFLRLFKKKYLMLLFAFSMHIITIYFIPNMPSWIFNVDSALYYLIYYSIGAILFQFIRDFDFKKCSKISKYAIISLCLMSIIITASVYFNNFISRILITTFIPLDSLIKILITLFLIIFNLLLAYFLRHIVFLQNLGKVTLILCGTEQMVKLIIFSTGFTGKLSTPLITLIYTLIILVINYYTITRLLNKFPIFNGKISLNSK